MRYVVIYVERSAIIIDAPNEKRAETRALAVLRNGAPDRDVTIEAVKR